MGESGGEDGGSGEGEGGETGGAWDGEERRGVSGEVGGRTAGGRAEVAAPVIEIRDFGAAEEVEDGSDWARGVTTCMRG